MSASDQNGEFARMQALFDEALLQPESEQDEWLKQQCGPNTHLLDDVRSLLRAHQEELNLSESLLNSKVEPAPHNKRLGPYRILSLLGRGGMGAVYLAERADGQYEQKVAIKLIDLPLATEVFFERFRQERQILAGLNHPDIARMLDGGVSDDGILYLVMEYVDGEPIDAYCRNHSPSLTERLALFTRVCKAVQFAHQNLVVHRDLKPDNILVSSDGAPHLLDFGTAKVLSPEKSADTLGLTRQGFLSFTPAYASPEQVLGKAITTASDTYSLGVLLYLLLTGELPYQLSEFTTEEMLAVICNAAPDPPKSSDGTFPDADLEAILAKALRKEPEDRYQTADQLTADVEAYLEHKPVSARKGTFRYTAQKFIRRNRLSIGFAAVLLLTVTVGVIGIVWQAQAARRAEKRAVARSADLLQLTDGLLSELDSAIQQLPGSTGAQQLLVSRVLKSLDPMATEAQYDKATSISLANAYMRLGNLQGDPYEQNIGDWQGGIRSMDKAVAILGPTLKNYPNDFAALETLAHIQNSRGEILSAADDNEGAVASLNDSISTFRRLLTFPHPTPKLYQQTGSAYDTLGDVVGQDTGFSDLAGALENYKKAIDLDNQALRIDPNYGIVRRGLVVMQMKLGNVDLDIDPAQALNEFRTAMDKLRALTPAEQAMLTNIRVKGLLLRKQGVALSELGQYKEAQPLFAESTEAYESIVKLDTKDERALRDIARLLENELDSAEHAADPRIAEAGFDQHTALEQCEELARKKVEVTQQLLKAQPVSPDVRNDLAAAQVHLAAAGKRLGKITVPSDEVNDALAHLNTAAEAPKASPRVLEVAYNAFAIARPNLPESAQLRLRWARRGSELTHHKVASWMLLLAEAERLNGASAEAKRDAAVGLALLPSSARDPKQFRLVRLLFENEQ